MRGGPRNELAWGDVTSRAGSGSQGVVVHHDAARQGGVQEHDSLRANAPEAQGTGEVEGAPDSRRDRCVGVPALSRERRRAASDDVRPTVPLYGQGQSPVRGSTPRRDFYHCYAGRNPPDELEREARVSRNV